MIIKNYILIIILFIQYLNKNEYENGLNIYHIIIKNKF
jgi:hypothetical protein